MRNLKEHGWFLDLPHTCDEVLLLLAREAHCQPARDELTCRYWRLFGANHSRCVWGYRFTSWDREDAHQEAFFWIQEAIRAFDSGQLSLPQGSSFQTFMNRVYRLRLADFLRSLHRHKKNFRPVQALGDWPRGFVRDHNLVSCGHREELQHRLEEALSDLDPSARALWHELSQGKRLHDLPHVLGVSYRTLKRRWRSLREQVDLVVQQLDGDVGKP
jgi:DNA-directed RNA polymerase specialized sigma24 family protein